MGQRGGDLRRVPCAVPDGGHIDIVPTHGDSAKEEILCSTDVHLQENTHPLGRCIYKTASLDTGPTGPMAPTGEDLDRSSSVQRSQNDPVVAKHQAHRVLTGGEA